MNYILILDIQNHPSNIHSPRAAHCECFFIPIHNNNNLSPPLPSMHHVLSVMQDVQCVAQQQQQQHANSSKQKLVHQDGLYLLRSFAASGGRLLLQGELVEHRETEG